MCKILVSWVAWYVDFQLPSPEDSGRQAAPSVSPTGPNYSLHKHFFGHKAAFDKHLLLSSGEAGEPRSALLYTSLKRDFPAHEIELQYLALQDPHDFQEIRMKALQALEPYRDCELWILHSTGTTPMRVSWMLIHLEDNGLHTRLLQSLDPMFTHGEPDFLELEVENAEVAYRLEIRQKQIAPTAIPEKRPPSLEAVYALAKKVAAAEQVPALLRGPSGSGKERLAGYIHEQSARHNGKFVAINCAELSDELFVSRLFGYEKGAFTGANQKKSGYIDEAQGGTLFLDEIGDVSPYGQKALLRLLQEKEYCPVGSSTYKKANVRILAATHQPLEQRCEAGLFRWDLYWRLMVAELVLPGWGEIPSEDRNWWIELFLREKAIEFKRPRLSLAPGLRELLLALPLPGNIRQLENLISAWYVFCDDTVSVSDLPPYMRPQRDALRLDTVIRAHAQRVWESCGQNYKRAAEQLEISVNTLKKYVQAPAEIG